MARQVLTLPDVPATLLTQAAGDARYSLVAHNHDAAYATVAHLHTGTYLPLIGGTLTGALVMHGGTGGTLIAQGQVPADTQPRFRLMANGQMEWGPGGSTIPDANLFRSGADMILSSRLWVRPLTGNAWVVARRSADGNPRALLGEQGAESGVWLGPGGGTGLDTSFLRTSAGVLRLSGASASFLEVRATGSLSGGRIGQAVPGARMDVSSNVSFDGTNWNLDDTAASGLLLGLSEGPALTLRAFPAGSNPASPRIKTFLSIGATGTLSLTPDAGTGINSLVAMGNVGVGIVPGTWHGQYAAIQVGQSACFLGGATAGPVFSQWTENSRNDGTAARAIITGAGSILQQSAGTLVYYTMPSVAAGATQALSQRFLVNANGTINITPASAAYAIDVDGTNSDIIIRRNGALALANAANNKSAGWRYWETPGAVGHVINNAYTGLWITDVGGFSHSASLNLAGATAVGISSTSGNLVLSAGGTVVHPTPDNGVTLGHPSYRWASVHAVNGAIQTSVYSAKEGFAPLDPSACASAVLETDWVSFSYLPPTPPGFDPPQGIAYDEHDSNEVKAEKKVARDEAEAGIKTTYLKAVAETAHTRDQKGYVLKSPEHTTHDLFGLADRESTSVASDLAVVACALQHCLLEIAELKARLA